MNEIQAQEMGYAKRYDFTQYSHDNNVNVIPEEDFKRLVQETFKCIADNLRKTYGPYASTVMLNSQNETYATKDGYNVFNALGFSHTYKKMVYLAIKKIIERVNRNVGDGTTSCILLAEKLFENLQKSIKTVDDKRNIFSVLNDIEAYLLDKKQIELDKDSGYVTPLTFLSLEGLIRMAGNYDDAIVDMLVEALKPEYDEAGVVTAIRNVVVDAKLENESDTLSYEIDYLPGDYRVRINMDKSFALTFMEPRPVRIALYDHTFGPDDWNFFMSLYDMNTKIDTILIARTFSKTFLENEWKAYLYKMGTQKRPVRIIPCEIKGEYLREEIKDLAAVLQTETIGLQAKPVDHDSLPLVNVQIHNGICMCFDMPVIPESRIEVVKHDRESDTSPSLTKKQWYDDRIRALSNTAQDTLVTVNATSSLEKKMVGDKIDDCVSIINSAMSYGTVPNLFSYGHYRMECYMEACGEDNALNVAAAQAINHAIEGLFFDIWKSKHGDSFEQKANDIASELYNSSDCDSFDIIKECFVPYDVIPTSAQYDLEVLAAAISIVKYLLTSNALVFDAFIMKPVDDTGKYEMV